MWRIVHKLIHSQDIMNLIFVFLNIYICANYVHFHKSSHIIICIQIVLCLNIHIGLTVHFNQSKYIVGHNIGVVHVQPVLVLNTSSSMNINIKIKSKGKNRNFY